MSGISVTQETAETVGGIAAMYCTIERHERTGEARVDMCDASTREAYIQYSLQRKGLIFYPVWSKQWSKPPFP